MTNDSKISWTGKTWNPVTGCSKVSEGCDYCYAETLSLRRGWSDLPWLQENAEQNVRLREDRLMHPFRWPPTRVFVNSMSDMFHPLVPDRFNVQTFAVMVNTPGHEYQILTKRPQRMAAFMNTPGRRSEVYTEATRILARRLGGKIDEQLPLEPGWLDKPWPPPNVWLGTSVENQKWADVRIPHLLRTPAAVRFLSCEPLLGPIDLSAFLAGGPINEDGSVGVWTGYHPYERSRPGGPTLHWVIVGGESGSHLSGPDDPRWMRQEWARALRDQCVDSGVAFFFKQDSGHVSELRPWIVEEDGRRSFYQQFPGDAGKLPLEFGPLR